MDARNRRDAELHIQELTALHRLQADLTANKAKATKTTWCGKQKEFFEWNSNKGYPNDLMSADKMLLFMTEIRNRSVYKRGRKRQISTADEEEGNVASSSVETPTVQTQSLSWNSLDGYVNALQNIWNTQHQLNKFPPGFPVPSRPPAIRNFLQNEKKDVVTRENQIFADRGIGSLADELDASQMGQLSKYYWDQGNEEGLKMKADYHLSFALTSRGDNIRNLNLSEIGNKFYPDESLSGAHILRAVWRKSKKNQYGKVQQNSLLRHKSAAECPFGSLGLYFFFRYHIRKDVWSDFSEAKNWYDLYVLPQGTRADRPMTYSKQYQAIRNAQIELGFSKSTKTAWKENRRFVCRKPRS